jgi:hypothetical protein
VDKLYKWLILISIIITGFLALEARYASSGFVNEINQRLDQKIVDDRMDNLQGRMWKLEDRYGIGCAECPTEVLNAYRDMKIEYDRLDEGVAE